MKTQNTIKKAQVITVVILIILIASAFIYNVNNYGFINF